MKQPLAMVTFASSMKVVKTTFILQLGSFLSSFRQQLNDRCGGRPRSHTGDTERIRWIDEEEERFGVD